MSDGFSVSYTLSAIDKGVLQSIQKIDKAFQALQKTTDKINRSFERTSKVLHNTIADFGKLEKQASKVSTGIGGINTDLRNLHQNAASIGIVSDNFTALDKNIKNSKFSLNGFSKELGTVGKNMSLYASLPVATYTGLSLKTFAEIEKTKKRFEVFFDNENQEALNTVISYANRTAFNFKEIGDFAVSLKAQTKLGANSIMQITKDLGDVVLGMGGGRSEFGNGSSGASLALTQIIGMGRLHAQEVNQLSNAKVFIKPLLASTFNKAMPEIEDMIRKNQISADMVVYALHKAAQDPKIMKANMGYTKTLMGSFDIFSGNLTMFNAKIGELFSQQFHVPDILQTLATQTAKATTWLDNLSSRQKAWLTGGALGLMIAGPGLLLLKKTIDLYLYLSKALQFVANGFSSIPPAAGAATTSFGKFINLISRISGAITILTAGFGIGSVLIGIAKGMDDVNSKIAITLRLIGNLIQYGSAFAAGYLAFGGGKLGLIAGTVAMAGMGIHDIYKGNQEEHQKYMDDVPGRQQAYTALGGAEINGGFTPWASIEARKNIGSQAEMGVTFNAYTDVNINPNGNNTTTKLTTESNNIDILKPIINKINSQTAYANAY